ncbi:hypothetical protein D3C84_901160 [compost metagenome]
MFAALIGVDGATKGHIRRAVVTDDAAGGYLLHLGAGITGCKCRFPLGLSPAVINCVYPLAAEAVINIVETASSCHSVTPILFIYTVILQASVPKYKLSPSLPCLKQHDKWISCLIPLIHFVYIDKMRTGSRKSS